MNLRIKKYLSLSIVLPSLLLFAGNALGQRESSQTPQKSSPRSAKERFVGAWKLVSFRVGQSYPMGRNAVGLLIYSADGRMSLQIMRPDRPKFTSMIHLAEEYEATPEEAESAYRGYFAYYGTYEVNEQGRSVTHHIEGSLFPNWVGKDRFELFELSRDRLTFGFDPTRYEWKRVK